MKITCSQDELAAQLCARREGGVDARLGAGARRRPAAGRGRPARARRDRHGALAAPRGRLPRSKAKARWSLPGACSSTSRGCCPTARSSLEHRPEQGTLEVDLRLGELQAQHLQRRGLPEAPRCRERGDLHGRPRRVPRDGLARRALGVARRVAAGADRDPRPLRGREARDGGDRLVPALRQGDGARRQRGRRARGDRPGARAHGARADRAGRGRPADRRAGEPRRVRRRRGLADDPPDRRAVPELQAAAAGDRSSTR